MNDPELNQSEIDALLADVSVDGPGEAEAAPAADPEPMDDPMAGLDDAPAADDGASDDDLAALLGDDSGGAADDAGMDMGGDDFSMDMDMGGGDPAPAAVPAAAPAAASAPVDVPAGNLEVLLDVPLEVIVELGRTDLQIKDILNLAPGAVVELNRMSGEPIDVMVNGKLVARGEVVVIDENFGIKITSIISPMERLTQLN